MRFLILAALAILVAATAQTKLVSADDYTVTNNLPAYQVTNNFPAPPAAKKKQPCTYCTNCTCASGSCPAKCPLTYADASARVAKGDVVYLSIGKRVEKVSVCNGATCVLVDVTAHTDALAGFTDGVWKCWRDASGKPVMQIVPK